MTADDCRWDGNRYGVRVTDQERFSATGGGAANNRKDGVEVSGDGRVSLTDFAGTRGTIAGNDGYGFALLGAVTVDCKDVRTAGNKSGNWKVAKTVPKLTRVANCGTGRDDRPRGIFG